MSGVLDVHLGGRRLSAFVDGELAPLEADRWRAHLLRCPTCTSAVAAERAVRARMRHSCTPAPSSHLLASLRVVAIDSALSEPPSRMPAADPVGASVTARRARRVVGAVMITTTTVAAAAVVGLAIVPGRAGGPTATPAAPPTAIDSMPGESVFIQADFGDSAAYQPPPMMRIAWHGSPGYGLTTLGGQ